MLPFVYINLGLDVSWKHFELSWTNNYKYVSPILNDKLWEEETYIKRHLLL